MTLIYSRICRKTIEIFIPVNIPYPYSLCFFDYYIECMRETAQVDINDFEIKERRQRFNGLLILFKRIVWNLLKYYTYRLWSQQNQVNGLLLSAVDAAQSRDRQKIRELEERLARLESGQPKGSR